jgi:hypothetical protein
MPEITFEADFDEKHVKYEDGKCALIWNHGGWDQRGDDPDNSEVGTCLKFWSWDESKEHKSIKRFIGKRVRITVEVASVLDQIVEAVEDDTGLGFEIGEKVRFREKSSKSMGAIRNRSAGNTINVVGLDVSSRQSVKVGYFIPGSGQLYDWFDPRDIEKLSVLDKLAEVQ